MKINFNIFLEWAKIHLDNIMVSGEKIKSNSRWCDDYKRHLWCKPSIGYYRCWKSGKKGTLLDLVMEVENCSYQEAVYILCVDYRLCHFEARVDALFSEQEISLDCDLGNILLLPSDTFPIKELSLESPLRKQVESYLSNRKLPVGSLYICVTGEYSNRIIIPYYNEEDKLVYWNARDFTGKAKIRYKGPHKELWINKENVIWMSFWPKNGTKIYLTEGEFDAMSLCQCGLHGAACGGKEVSKFQINLLSPYNVCISFDNYISGKNALIEVGDKMRRSGLCVSYIRPPKKYKDWNEMLCKSGSKVISAYIENNERFFTGNTVDMLRM